jgi:hypothetical protein
MDGSMSARELAAVALGAIGPDAKDALPVLIRLAEVHAKDEWSLAKDKQPKLLPDHFGGEKCSDDYLVDAICKIRRKRKKAPHECVAHVPVRCFSHAKDPCHCDSSSALPGSMAFLLLF